MAVRSEPPSAAPSAFLILCPSISVSGCLTVHNIWIFIGRIPAWLLTVLDWLVSVAERLLVIGFAWVALRLGYQVLHGIDSKGNQEILKTITDNWKAVLILFLVPLFYRTTRRFLERARKFAGIEAEAEEAEEEPNPSSDD
jgi:hypothetical protein